MSASAFATIKAALLAALQVSPALASGHISADQLSPVPAGQTTALVLRMGHSDGVEQPIGSLTWQTEYTVECYARTVGGVDAAVAVDTLLSDTWARLAALDFTALGASVTVTPKIIRDNALTDTPSVCFELHLTAQHMTDLVTLQPRT